MMNNSRIKYHLRNKEVLENEANHKNILIVRLAIIEDIISGLRRDKIQLRKELDQIIISDKKDISQLTS